MKIGDYEIYSVKSGMFRLDGGAMFGVVPKVFWDKTNPADELNRILLTTRSLLLISDKRKILVDTGIGNKFDEKFKNIYAIQNNPIDEVLKQKNINPDEVTDVILTHLHFDHAGGSTKKISNEFVPTFRNANYYVQRKHLEWAINPSEKDKASFLKEDFIPLMEKKQLVIEDGNFQMDESIKILTSNGHTPFQQHLKISDGEKTLFYCGDMIPTTSHIPIPYVMSYDLFPLSTMEEKKKILTKASEENWILFFEHDPEISSVIIQKADKGFKISEKNLVPEKL